MIIEVILAILLFLAICVIVYQKGQLKLADKAFASSVAFYEKEIADNNAAWEQGRDELEEMYQGQYLTLGELYQACDNALEATTEELREYVEGAENARQIILSMDQKHTNLMRLVEERERALVRADEQMAQVIDQKDHQLKMVMIELERYEELYAEAATELLDTNNEIDKIAKEVHEWVSPKGSPFD